MISSSTASTLAFYIFMAPLALGESAVPLAAPLSCRSLSLALNCIAIPRITNP